MAARRRAAPSDDAPVEILDEAGGPELGIDFGILCTTWIALLAAVILVVLALANHYGRGPLA